MMNRILFLTNSYPDSDSPSRGIFIKKLAGLLQNEGYRIIVVTPKIFRGSPCFEKQNGVKVYRFPFFAGNKLLIEYQNIPYLKMVFYYLSGFFLTSYILLKEKCSLIHVHWAIPTGLIAVLTERLLKRRFVVTIHGSDFRMAFEGSALLRKIFLWVCRKAGQLNCVSDVMRQELEGMGIQREKISAFPMGIDDAFLGVGKNRGKRPGGRPCTIVSNRKLFPIYNLSLLIRAIPIVLKEEPRTRFVIAGDGPDAEKLENQTKSLNISPSIEFLGRVPHGQMPEILSQADIYVSTSLHDGTSVSLLEAMGAGTFPIVTDIPANREWITHGENGFLIPVDRELSLANRIIEAIRNPSLVERSRTRNLLMVEEKAFWPANIRKVEAIYARMLSS